MAASRWAESQLDRPDPKSRADEVERDSGQKHSLEKDATRNGAERNRGLGQTAILDDHETGYRATGREIEKRYRHRAVLH